MIVRYLQMIQLCMPLYIGWGQWGPTALSLSADLSKAARWAQTWGMLFSAEKSDVLTIGKRKDHPPETGMNMERISMDSVRVPVCQKHKHLGVQINNRLSWLDHVDELYCDGMSRLAKSSCCAPFIREFQINVLQRFILGTFVPAWNTDALFGVEAVHRSYVVFMKDFVGGIRHGYHRWRSASSISCCWCSLTPGTAFVQSICPNYGLTLWPLRSSQCELRRVIYPVPRVNKSSSLCSFFPRAIIFWNSLPAGIQSSPSMHRISKLLWKFKHLIFIRERFCNLLLHAHPVMFSHSSISFFHTLVSWIRHFPFLFLHLFSLLSFLF